MKYLKNFETESDYLAYRNDKSKYLKPNVSLCDDKESVYYNFTPPPIVYEAVDLGLPSGTKWASQNVGASKPSDAGLYFQWGDVQGYTQDQIGYGKKWFSSSWTDYKWGVDGSTFTKYDVAGATLELKDDAAHANMGGDWHMPTPTQIRELFNNTTNTWTTSDDGVNGRLFTSKKDDSKSIFIPAAGAAWDGSVHGSGDDGDVWSSMLNTGDVNNGQSLDFDSDYAYLDSSYRYLGFSVRGVLG